MNDHYMRFVGYDTCNRLIWTNGLKGSKNSKMPMSNNTQKCFGFINDVHIDIGDIVRQDDTKKWFTKI